MMYHFPDRSTSGPAARTILPLRPGEAFDSLTDHLTGRGVDTLTAEELMALRLVARDLGALTSRAKTGVVRKSRIR